MKSERICSFFYLQVCICAAPTNLICAKCSADMRKMQTSESVVRYPQD